MRVMENVEVYRARLAGGVAPLTIAADLKRGGWTPSVTTPNPYAVAKYGQAAGGAPVAR